MSCAMKRPPSIARGSGAARKVRGGFTQGRSGRRQLVRCGGFAVKDWKGASALRGSELPEQRTGASEKDA